MARLRSEGRSILCRLLCGYLHLLVLSLVGFADVPLQSLRIPHPFGALGRLVDRKPIARVAAPNWLVETPRMAPWSCRGGCPRWSDVPRRSGSGGSETSERRVGLLHHRRRGQKTAFQSELGAELDDAPSDGFDSGAYVGQVLERSIRRE